MSTDPKSKKKVAHNRGEGIIEYKLYLKNNLWCTKCIGETTIKNPEQHFIDAIKAFKKFYPSSKNFKTIENKDWPLEWYWQRFLAIVPKLNVSKKKNIELKISQIAESVFLCLIEDGTLLLPPTFCSVERISRKDQYDLYLNQFHDEIVREVESLQSKKNSIEYDYDRALKYVLGRHDIVYKFSDKNGKIGLEKLECGDIKIRCTSSFKVHPFISNLKISKTVSKDEINRYFPWHVIEMPPPRKGEDLKKNQIENTILPPFILLSSRSVRKAFERISEVWNDPTAKSVLLIAPPGSGKEVFSKTIYYGKCLSGKYRQMSLAEGSPKDIALTLFGKTLIEDSKKDESVSNNGGFVAQASGGALLIDEVDKAIPEARSMLLRLLESESYVIPGTSQIVHLEASMPPPLYIFTGSLSRKDMFALEPLDFWTRISHIIEIRHPLDSDDPEGQKLLYSDYFSFFWLLHIPKLFKKSGLTADDDYVEKSILSIYQYYNAALKLLLNVEVVRVLSNIFTQQFYFETDKFPSIRNIRSIVGRVAFEIVELVLYDKDPRKSWRTLINSDKDGFEELKCLFVEIGKNNLITSNKSSIFIFEKIISDIFRKAINGVV